MWLGTVYKWSEVWCSGMGEKKRNTLRWFGHMEKKKREELVKKVYVSEIDGARKRGRSVVGWKDVHAWKRY